MWVLKMPFDTIVRMIALLAVIIVLISVLVFPANAHEAPSGKWEYEIYM